MSIPKYKSVGKCLVTGYKALLFFYKYLLDDISYTRYHDSHIREISMKNYSTHFGRLLKEERKRRGVAQAEVARRIGLKNNGYIAQLEKGMYGNPSDSVMRKYARAIGITLEDIEKIKRKATLINLGIDENNIFMDMIRIPLLGEVPCGEPKEAIEVADEFIAVPYDRKLANKQNLFALTAHGLSMKDADILPGDKIVIDPYSYINNGDIVVAMIGDDATLKYYYEKDGYVELRPANEDFKPIKVDDPTFKVIGKVIMKVKVEMYI